MVKGRAALSANCRLQCYIRMTLWKCITFFSTQPFQPSSKAPLLHCYRNTSRGEFDLCAFPMSPPSLSSSVEHNFSLFSPSPRHCISAVTSRRPATRCPLKHPRTWRACREHLHSGGGKAEICSLVFFFSLENILLEDKCFIQGDIQVHSKCRDYTHTEWKTSSVGSMLYSYISCQTNKRSENHK